MRGVKVWLVLETDLTEGELQERDVGVEALLTAVIPSPILTVPAVKMSDNPSDDCF